MSGKGTSHFKHQRWTAVANVPLVIFLVGFILVHLGATRAEVLSSVDNPLIALLLTAATISILWHMWLGMQVIIEDYLINSNKFRPAMLANTLFVAALAAFSLYTILKLSFAS